jgi:hypothetical protein
MVVVLALVLMMPRLIAWYNTLRILSDDQNYAILAAFYVCDPVVLYALWNLEKLLRNIAAGQTRWARAVPTYAEGAVSLKPAGEIRAKFYIRFMLADRPGAFGTIASILGKHGVSISAATQKAGSEGNQPVPVVVLTHRAKTADLEAAFSEIKATGVIGSDPVSLRVL